MSYLRHRDRTQSRQASGPRTGTGTGTWTFTGTAVGDAPGASSGSGSGTWSFVGEAVGSAPGSYPIETFESGSHGATVSTSSLGSLSGAGALTYDNTRAAKGTQSGKLVLAANTRFIQASWTSDNATRYFQQYFYPDSWSTNAQIWSAVDAGTRQGHIRFIGDGTADNGKLSLRNSSAVEVVKSSTVLSAGQWARIEVEYIPGGIMTIRLFTGANLNSSTPTETMSGAVGGTGVWTAANFGVSGANATGTFYLDDLAHRTTGWIGPSVTTGTVMARLSGAVTPSSAIVSARLTSASAVRLAVATDTAFTSPINSELIVPDAQGWAKMPVSGLAANTTYYYAVEFLEGDVWNRDVAKRGEFKTFPPNGVQTFMFAHGNCNPTTWDGPVFDRIRESGALFFAHTGDIQYTNSNDGTDSEAARDLWRNALYEHFTTPKHDAMYGKLSMNYVWDDHDYCGDNSHGGSAGRFNAAKVYRQVIPHYPLGATDGLGTYQTFVCGRVRFILLDTRAYRSDPLVADPGTFDVNGHPTKTMLGATQWAWLQNTMLTSPQQIFCIMSSVPWNVYTLHDTPDSWGVYPTARTQIVNWLHANGFKGRIFIFNGDMHGLAADDGTNSPGQFPVVIGGALGSAASQKGGPYSHGVRTGNNQYGRINISDNGAQVVFTFTGRESVSGVDTTHITMAVTVPPPQRVRPAADVSAGLVTAPWTDQVGGASLFAAVDEELASDADYIQSADAMVVGSEAKVRLAALVDPVSDDGHVLRYRYGKNTTGGDTVNLTVRLYRADGSTVVASQTHASVDATVDGSINLTAAQAASIPSADYATGLVLGFEAVKP